MMARQRLGGQAATLPSLGVALAAEAQPAPHDLTGQVQDCGVVVQDEVGVGSAARLADVPEAGGVSGHGPADAAGPVQQADPSRRLSRGCGERRRPLPGRLAAGLAQHGAHAIHAQLADAQGVRSHLVASVMGGTA